MRNAFILAALALLAAPAAFAQQDTEPEQPSKKVREVYKAVETHDENAFPGATIDGGFVKPAGRMIPGRGYEKFDSMIEERAHFKKDLAKSIRLNVKTAETTTK